VELYELRALAAAVAMMKMDLDDFEQMVAGLHRLGA